MDTARGNVARVAARWPGVIGKLGDTAAKMAAHATGDPFQVWYDISPERHNRHGAGPWVGTLHYRTPVTGACSLPLVLDDDNPREDKQVTPGMTPSVFHSFREARDAAVNACAILERSIREVFNV
jgi:hypothetical protein